MAIQKVKVLKFQKGIGKFGLVGRRKGEEVFSSQTFRKASSARKAASTRIAKKAQKSSGTTRVRVFKLVKTKRL